MICNRICTVAPFLLGIFLVLAALTGVFTTTRRIVFVETLSINNVMPPFVYQGDHRRFYGLTIMPMCPRRGEEPEQPTSAGKSCTVTPDQAGVKIVLNRGLRSGRGNSAANPEDLARGLEMMLPDHSVTSDGETLEVRQSPGKNPSIPVPLLEPWLQLQASAVLLKQEEEENIPLISLRPPEGTGPFYVDSLCYREERRGYWCYSSTGLPSERYKKLDEQYGELAIWLNDALVLKRNSWSFWRRNEIVFLGLAKEFSKAGLSKEEEPSPLGPRVLVQALDHAVVHAVLDIEDELRRRLNAEGPKSGGAQRGWRFTAPKQDSVLVAALKPASSPDAEDWLPDRCRARLIHALALVRRDPAFLRAINAQAAEQLLPGFFGSVHEWKHADETQDANEDPCSIELLTNTSWSYAAHTLADKVEDVDPYLKIIPQVKSSKDEGIDRAEMKYGISLLSLVYRPHPPAFYLWDNLMGSGWATQKHMRMLEDLARRETKVGNQEQRETILAELDALHQQLDQYLIPIGAPNRVAAVNNRLLGLDPGKTPLNPDQLRLTPTAIQTTIRFILLVFGVLLIAAPVYVRLAQQAAARETRIEHSLRMLRHDVLAPMTSIKAQAERVGKQDKKAAIALLAEAEAALAIAEDARFQVQKGKARTYDNPPTDLRDEVIEPILGTLRRRARYEEADLPAVTLDLPDETPPVALPADVARFVVRVLIENSWRHRGEHPLQLEIVGKVVRKRYCLEVRDWGPGISEEDLKHLFRPGHRTDGPRKQAREGSGMGLHLARSVLKYHGGSIELRNTSNPTTFQVCFPVASKHDRNKVTQEPETEKP